ncbi:MAG: T9SS type A sorting domain-containing protein [Flavipsychrobacter sp.]|nr:T9SS type A sorting domain-containing protein [Flavipsychrobacter sp.]
MKKIILSALLAATFTQTHAQQVITDTVSIGTLYANQVWYSLKNDQQGIAPKANWDIAFDVSGFGSGIMINSVIGTTLWKYPKADIAGWSSVDTTGLSTWTAHYNSDTSWALGAMGNYTNPTNPYDLDWGLYNITTHAVTGDSIYIIKLADTTYRKLWIESLSGSIYTFKYANLDGTNLQSATLDKSAYTGKNFGYFSIRTNAALDREPATVNWDLVFTQYTAFIPMAYTVTGVLSNNGVQVAKLGGITNAGTYSDYSTANFSSAINSIGYNWKTFSGTAYVVQDSLLYFVKPLSGDIWKVMFTGFDGSSTGNFIFSKQKLATSSIPSVNGAPAASLALYPNPSNGQAIHVAYSFDANVPSAMVSVYDVTGKLVAQDNLDTTSGLHQYQLPTLHTSMYIVEIEAPGTHLQQKLIVQ